LVRLKAGMSAKEALNNTSLLVIPASAGIQGFGLQGLEALDPGLRRDDL
jgi:hypothetical protein